jgi:hypothetical protein
MAGIMHVWLAVGEPSRQAEEEAIMSVADLTDDPETFAPALIPPSDETAAAAEIVIKFLVASMVPDPETAALYISEPLKLTFTGGRKFSHPRESTAFNAMRYKWVKKAMERTDVVPGRGETIVYSIGTLYGEWPDGTSFEGNRYVDRFVVRSGKIVQMDVWNDSAERLLTRHGIVA